MSKRVTTEDFIQRARGVHGDRYDYSKTVYVAAKKKVTIICPEHGEFEQQPHNHFRGNGGCRECAGNKPLTLEKFIERANKAHGNRYDYSRVQFQNVEDKIEIICPDHGPFYQRLFSHLKGIGCNQCGRIVTGKKLAHSLNRFLDDAKKAHGDHYGYSQVEYVNALTKVTIICPNHGPFKQTPASHIRDIGCPKCGDERMAEKRVKSTEEFVEEATAIHGDRYDYSKVQYKTSHDKVKIICPEHGAFMQTPANHTNTSHQAGCPGCALSGFDQTKPGILYYLAITTDSRDTLYKIGITNLTVERRFPNLDLTRIRIIRIWHFEVGGDAAERESAILNQFEKDQYYGPKILVGAGNTELFTRDVLELDTDETGRIVDESGNLVTLPT